MSAPAINGHRLRAAGTEAEDGGKIVAAALAAPLVDDELGDAVADPAGEFTPEEPVFTPTVVDPLLPGAPTLVCPDDCPAGDTALVPLGGVAATTAGSPNADCCTAPLGGVPVTPSDCACIAAAEIRLESESRRSRARSVRNSAACW